MTREGLEILIYQKYGVRADYPFAEDFESGVFRHTDNGKWFGIAMRIPKRKLSPCDEGTVDVLNLKCAPEVIEGLVGNESGIYPAYHMNKMHWLTVLLDGTCDDATVEWILDISFDLTKKKRRG